MQVGQLVALGSDRPKNALLQRPIWVHVDCSSAVLAPQQPMKKLPFVMRYWPGQLVGGTAPARGKSSHVERLGKRGGEGSWDGV